MQTPPSKTLIVAVDIVFPAANSQVPGGGDFVAYGDVLPDSSTMTAWIMDGTTRYDGDPTDPPANHDWAFVFEGIPTGHAVQLTVKGVSGMNEAAPTISITCVT